MTKPTRPIIERYARPLLIILGFVFVLSFLLRISFIANAVNNLRFVLYQGGTDGTEFIRSARITKETLTQERNSFREQLALAAVNSSELISLQEENARLKELLGYQEHDAFERIPARVLGADTATYTYTIDQGSEDGVSIADTAVAGNGIFAGIVTALTPHTATVSTSQANGIRVIAQTADGSPIGVIEGEGGYLLHAPFIPKTTQLTVGAPVLTHDNTPNIPNDLVIGTIDTSTRNEQDAFQNGFLRPWYDIHELTFIEIFHLP
ncbi:MAG: rod shape-determining protein MreC [bacterium]|nr:rod shape-determining protein MreC [bacterium]MDA1024647.1 rod shape-determining protein MreC [bacterium]